MKKANLREAYGRELVKLAEKNKEIVALDADLSASTMSCYLEEKFPERFFEMGIAEQNMASVAAGLALAGKKPFINTFAVFATGRAYDQIRQGIALPNLEVCIAGSSCGLSDYGDGATHQAIDDIAIMRAVPNMTVISPVDVVETRKALKAIVKHDGPVYLRITRTELPIITSEENDFNIGEINKVADGNDITIFATGLMVHKALEARAELKKKGISVRVINVSTIKPLNKEQIRKYSDDVKGIITAEEHNVIGGLGGAISEVLSDELIKIKIIGVEDRFGQSANNYEDILKHYGLTVEKIVEKANEIL